MHCFNHQDRHAIGSCKACHKGLCADCVTDMGHGLACKGTHEDMVETYHSIVSRSARIYQTYPRGSLIAPAFYLAMGLLFIGYAVMSGDGPRSFLFLMGCGFIVFAVVFYRFNRKAFGTSTQRD